MKIIKLTKVKLGDSYPIVRITFKNLFGKKIKRDVVEYPLGWKYADNNRHCHHVYVLNMFNKSKEYEYILNIE